MLAQKFHTQRRFDDSVFQRVWSVVARCFSPRTEFAAASERGLKPRATTWAPEREISDYGVPISNTSTNATPGRAGSSGSNSNGPTITV